MGGGGGGERREIRREEKISKYNEINGPSDIDITAALQILAVAERCITHEFAGPLDFLL